jgi:tripartite-type tricarboxylate transporter receptor subunit TctC
MKKILCIMMVTMILLAAVGCSSSAPVASEPTAAKFPTSTIKIIVPFNAGGSTDMLARLVAPELSTRLGVPVIVENKAGGGGAIGMVEMINSKPDGHTLILCSVNAATLTPNNSDVGYTNKEMLPISQLTKVSTGIIVNAESGITTLDELVAAAEANPGKMTFATSGAGSIHHLAAELFMKEIGKPGLVNHVPFDSGTEAITAVLGKQIDFSFGDAADSLPFVQQGKLRVLAMAADPGRDSFFPDAPSFKELGYNIPQMGPWTAIAAPAGTPKEVITKLDETVKEVMELPNVVEGLKKLSLAPSYMNSNDITNKWMTEYDQNKALIEGLKK